MSAWHTLNLLAGAWLGATWLFYAVAARRGMRGIADLTQPEYAVAPDLGLIAFHANAVEHAGRESLVSLQRRAIAVHKNRHLADPRAIPGDFHAIGLLYENICGHSYAG